jgi:CO/xanthine dehydrogenase Mo-binding subunit
VVEGNFVPDDKDPLPVIGAHFCEVEVDHVTGVVRVLRYIAAQDVGRVINVLGCRGQIEGGVHHGLGYALCEELLFDEGQPINSNFMGYKVLMAADMPEIEAVLVEVPDPDGGPYGAKGVGTPVIPAIAPAVANAIRDAIGARLHHLPMSPPKVLAAIVSNEQAGSPQLLG